MRVVFIGAGTLTVSTADMLIRRGHDVVIIDGDKERVQALSEELDCGFIHGDGTRPAILQEANPGQADFLFCLTDNDQSNIIASLVGRSQGFERVVTMIADSAFEHICTELGLSNTIVPNRTISRTLADMVEGHDILELSTMIKGEVRFFAFLVREEDEVPVSELKLPDHTAVVCIYRDDDFLLPDPERTLVEGEQVLLVTHRKHLEKLRQRWGEHEQS